MRQTVPNLPSSTAHMKAIGITTLSKPVPEHALDKPAETVSKGQWTRLIGLIADGVKPNEAIMTAGVKRYTLEGILRTDAKRKEQWEDAKISSLRRMWDMDTLDEIFADIAGGTLVKVAVEDRGLDSNQFYKLVLNDPLAFEQYEKALQIQCERMSDEIIEISDDSKHDRYEDGKGNMRVDSEVVNRSRLKVDARKWKMATLHSKRFGAKTQTNIEANIVIDHAARLEEARARARNQDKVVAVQEKNDG